jgi:hypothetical protein
LDIENNHPVLVIKHSRAKLIMPFLISQFIGMLFIYALYAVLNGLVKSEQLPLAYLGLLGGLFAYATLTSIFALKLVDTSFLTLYENGHAFWKPSFKRHLIIIPPDSVWMVQDKYILFRDPNTGDIIQNLELAPTIDRSFAQRITQRG